MTARALALSLLVVAGCKSSSSQSSSSVPPPSPSSPPTPSRPPASAASPSPSSAEEESPSLRDVDLGLQAQGGKPARLGPYLGAKLTLVNLWATWCGPCREEMPRLSRLHEREAPNGLQVVGVSLDEDHAAVQRFLKQRPVKYPVLFGGKATTDKLGELPALPATLVLSKDGKVDRVLFGALDDETEKGVVEELHKK